MIENRKDSALQDGKQERQRFAGWKTGKTALCKIENRKDSSLQDGKQER